MSTTVTDPNDSAYFPSLFAQLVSATRLTHSLPAQDDHKFLSTYPHYATASGAVQKRVLSLIAGIANAANPNVNVTMLQQGE